MMGRCTKTSYERNPVAWVVLFLLLILFVQLSLKIIRHLTTPLSLPLTRYLSPRLAFSLSRTLAASALLAKSRGVSFSLVRK